MSNLYSFAIGVGSKNSRGEWLEVFYPAPLLNPEQGLSDIVAVSLGLTSGEIEPSSEQLAAFSLSAYPTKSIFTAEANCGTFYTRHVTIRTFN